MDHDNYKKMPFDELFNTVFTESGRIKACGRDACRAMIERLEKVYGTVGEFGNAELGRLDEHKAYLAAKGLLWLKPG